MRIIAGKYRSRKILAPSGVETRPTLDRIRESLFNILGQRCKEAVVLDLFAGSGALGLEAISRGAKQAVFCDISLAAVEAIRTNIASLAEHSNTRLMQMDWHTAVRQLECEKVVFDIVFLDPPYKMTAAPVIEVIANAGLLNKNALIILEHDRRTQVELSEMCQIVDQRHYGDTEVSLIAPNTDLRIGEHIDGQ